MNQCPLHLNNQLNRWPNVFCEYCIEFFKLKHPDINWESKKICNKCNQEKIVALFVRNKGCKDGFAGICKKCSHLNYKNKKSNWSPQRKQQEKDKKIKWMKENLSKNKNWHLQHHLKRQYSLTLNGLETLKKFQNYKCAICSHVLEKPCVDHNHKDGQIRGLLCRNCNTGLGFFKDKINTLISAINYLECNLSNREEKRFELDVFLASENKETINQ